MNANTTRTPSLPPRAAAAAEAGPRAPVDAEMLRHRLALRLAAGLHERAEAIPADIGERLRFARERALAEAAGRRPPSPVVLARGAGVVGLRWLRAASWAPLLLLLAGLLAIEHWNLREQVHAAAEIDAELLADDLPPQAYADPGFLEFLKLPPLAAAEPSAGTAP